MKFDDSYGLSNKESMQQVGISSDFFHKFTHTLIRHAQAMRNCKNRKLFSLARSSLNFQEGCCIKSWGSGDKRSWKLKFLGRIKIWNQQSLDSSRFSKNNSGKDFPHNIRQKKLFFFLFRNYFQFSVSFPQHPLKTFGHPSGLITSRNFLSFSSLLSTTRVSITENEALNQSKSLTK